MTWLPLTSAQQGLFFAHALAPDNPAYSTAEYVAFDGPVDPARLRTAINAAYREFEQLRTVYRLGDVGPQQRVLEHVDRTLPLLDVADDAAAQQWMRADLARPMDPTKSDVTRTALLSAPDGPCWWYHAAHHLVLDGYGAQQLIMRVAALYDGAQTCDPLPLTELVAADPAAASPAAQAFWDSRLAGFTGVTALAGRTAAPAPRAVREAIEVDKPTQRVLVEGARRLGSSWADLVTAAVGSYTARMGGLATARIGVPLMNRSAPGIGTLPSARTVCTAMNVLPVTLPGTGTVADALAAARAEQLVVRDHPFLRQEDLARRLQRRDATAQLFGLQLNLIPFSIAIDLRSGPEPVHGVLHNLTAGPVEDMTVGLRGTPGRRGPVRLEIDANPLLYDAESLRLHLRRLLHWITTFATSKPEDELTDLALLDASEHAQVVEAFNRTEHLRTPATLAHRFITQARATPNAVALIHGERALSYGQLYARASEVASRLVRSGVRPQDVVGVALPRSFALFEAIYGVLLADAVYLPLDPDLPQARIDGMLSDARAVRVISLDGITAGVEDVPHRPDTGCGGVDDPAYVLLADRASRRRVTDAAVRNLVTSGEALPADLAHDAHECFGVPVVNLYGPTEAAVDVTAWVCSPDDVEIPIGHPIWNTYCYVLDDQQRPVPIGVGGHLWLGGVQLADGYAGRPDLTEQAFCSNPFRPGERMYRTGDLAAWRPDGALRYLGRGDTQVKLRGQRLELGEVEAVISALPGVAATAAGLVGDELIAWYVPHDPAADAAVFRQQLVSGFAAAMPASFQPHHWVPVDRIPLTPSGKTDRRGLEQAAAPPHVGTAVSTGPRDLMQQRVCAVFADVLGITGVDPDADFFTLGGDSLRVLRVLSALEDQLGVRVALGDVFTSPTAAGLAEIISTGTPHAGTAELLTLRRGVDDAPLFLLPPAGGLGWCYTSLLRSLPPELAVHTIQAPGLLDGAPEPAADLRALAHRQLDVIRQIVGDGPFHVAGWSLGGMAAHAVAALARARGQQVGAVVLLDAYPSDQWRHLPEPTETEALVGLLRLGGVDAPATELDRAKAVQLLRESGSAIGQLPEQVVAGCVVSVMQSSAIVRGSSHDLLDGDITVVVADAPRPETWVDPAGWEPYVNGCVRTTRLRATHGELVRAPIVDDVGRIITDAITAAHHDVEAARR